MSFQNQTRIAELTRLFLEKEAELERLCVEMRAALHEADEEARRLRAEAEHFNLEIFTEPEAAARLRMSEDTLSRLRKRKRLPHFREGMLVRYTSAHLVKIVELLEEPRPQSVKQKRVA